MSKTIKSVQRVIKLEAASTGSGVVVPDKIHLMSIGHWHTPWHGAFEMTATDLSEMITNFEKGTGLVEDSKKAPINYGHDRGGKAAGWITSLFVENNGTELWGDIEWTPPGRQALEDGEYRYISPEWNPRDWPWENPQVEGEYADNVFTGAGLTNIPLFTKLKPVMASTDAGNSDNDNQDEGGDMNLAEVRVKKLEDLTDDEKAFLAEHKAELNDDQRTAFQLVEEDGSDDSDDDNDDDQDDDASGQGGGAQGSTQSGLTASQLKQLQADAAAGREALKKLARKEAQEFVSASVAKGRIKSDHSKDAVELLLASAGDQRKNLEKFIENLPENEMLTAGELGDGKGGEGTSAVDQVFAQAQARVDEGKSKNINEAVNAVLKADSGLAKQFEADRKSK